MKILIITIIVVLGTIIFAVGCKSIIIFSPVQFKEKTVEVKWQSNDTIRTQKDTMRTRKNGKR